jgi:hypothetical protein
MADSKPKKFTVGEKVLLDATVTKVDGEQVVVSLNINTTAKDLRKFDQSTDSILD